VGVVLGRCWRCHVALIAAVILARQIVEVKVRIIHGGQTRQCLAEPDKCAPDNGGFLFVC
jgi:hypothetical protein